MKKVRLVKILRVVAQKNLVFVIVKHSGVGLKPSGLVRHNHGPYVLVDVMATYTALHYKPIGTGSIDLPYLITQPMIF